MSKKRFDSATARQRAADTSTDFANPVDAANAFPTPDARALRERLERVTQQQGVLTRVMLDAIKPSDWQARVDFSGVESLVRTIGGADGEAGVGVLEPVLLQRLAEDRYRLIDGESRWRAAVIVADRDGDAARDIPAVVFDVDDATAQLMGLVVNEDRNRYSAFELAVAYARAKAALEASQKGSGGLRRMEAIFAGKHKRASLGVYTSTGQWLTRELMAQVNSMANAPHIEPQELSRLRRQDLRTIADAAKEGLEKGALKLRECITARLTAKPKPRRETLGLAAQIVACNDDGIGPIRSKPLEVLPREQARRLLEEQLVGAFVATAERGWGTGSEGGVYAATTAGRHVLVMPSRTEVLSDEQLQSVLPVLEALLVSVRRAVKRAKRAGSASSPNETQAPAA